MSSRDEALLELNPRSVEAVLDDLVARRQRSRDHAGVRQPLVTLHLRNGRDMQGYVLGLKEERGQWNLLLHAPGADLRQPEDDALYLNRASVEAVTVHNVSWLSSEPARSEPAPGRVQLQRLARDLGDAVGKLVDSSLATEIDFEGVPDGEALWGLADVIKMTETSLLALAADDTGRAAVRAVKRLRFGAGSSPSVDKAAGVIVVRTTLRGPESRMTESDLKAALAKAL